MYGFAKDDQGYRFISHGYTKDNTEDPDTSARLCQGQPRLLIQYSRVHQGQFRRSQHISTASPRTPKATSSLLADTPRTIPRIPIQLHGSAKSKTRLPNHLARVHQGRFRGSRHICTASPRTTKATDSPLAGTPRTTPRIPTQLHGFAKDNQGYRLTSGRYTKDDSEDPAHVITLQAQQRVRNLPAVPTTPLAEDINSSSSSRKR